jgi:glutamate synthase domain-containing protein 3
LHSHFYVSVLVAIDHKYLLIQSLKEAKQQSLQTRRTFDHRISATELQVRIDIHGRAGQSLGTYHVD